MEKKEQPTDVGQLSDKIYERQEALLMEALGFALLTEKRVGDIINKSGIPGLTDKLNELNSKN